MKILINLHDLLKDPPFIKTRLNIAGKLWYEIIYWKIRSAFGPGKLIPSAWRFLNPLQEYFSRKHRRIHGNYSHYEVGHERSMVRKEPMNQRGHRFSSFDSAKVIKHTLASNIVSYIVYDKFFCCCPLITFVFPAISLSMPTIAWYRHTFATRLERRSPSIQYIFAVVSFGLYTFPAQTDKEI